MTATARPALPSWATRHRFSVSDYHRMNERGVFAGEGRVELIDGEVIARAAIGGPHIGAVIALTRVMMVAVGDRAVVSVQNSIRLDDRSEPQPDLVLLRPRADRYRGEIPPLAEDVLLVIEVADSSLRYDREVKLPLYAQHGIREVWIVDLAGGGIIEMCRGPGECGYFRVERLGAKSVLEPEALPGVCIAADEVLTG